MELVLDCAEPRRLEGFWQAALGYRSLLSVEDIVVLVPDDDIGSPLILQRVPEPKNGKNRMHLDIIRDDVEAEVSRLKALGARRLHDGLRTMGPVRWVAMADPDDNEFCVSTGVEW
jgi:catechol 2,3-dioxygenase-like lactoylglutathione lyase family enzyme